MAMAKYRYECRRCGYEHNGIFDKPAAYGDESWICPKCGGDPMSVMIHESVARMALNNPTQYVNARIAEKSAMTDDIKRYIQPYGGIAGSDIKRGDLVKVGDDGMFYPTGGEEDSNRCVFCKSGPGAWAPVTKENVSSACDKHRLPAMRLMSAK